MMTCRMPALVGGIAACFFSLSIATAQEHGDFTVTLLGAGVPDPRIDRFGGSTLVQAGGLNLVFDAGRGAMQRIDQLGIVPAKIDHIFLTHFQSDRAIGLPDLWLTPWLPPQGLHKMPRTITGPVGTKQLTEGLSMAYADDLCIRIADAGLNPNGVEWGVTAFSQDGPVFEQNGVTVTAFANFHGEHIHPSYGYRIDFDGRSVVISGDTKPNDNVIKYAAGGDLQILSVAMVADKIKDNPPIKAIMGHHTNPIEATKSYSGPMAAGIDLMPFDIAGTVQVNMPEKES